MASTSEVRRYRTGMASLLAKLVEAVGETERWLDVAVEGIEASSLAVPGDDPSLPFRMMGTALLRKAKIHMVAMLRANQNGNVHSLAVQMRPVLECAGQVVLVFHNQFIEPERGVSVVRGYLNADYYGTVIGLMEGDRRHEQLLTQITEASGMSKEEVNKGRSLRQEDKVAPLEGGKEWYRYLSNCFCHGEVDWRGHSWQGGISSINTVQDEYTFAGLMDYLVNQVAVMNAYAALCPTVEGVEQARVEATLTQLHDVRAATKALRDGVRLAVGNPDEGEQGWMIAGGMNSQGMDDDEAQELRARCERCRGLLGELARIHLAIDAPTRRMQADEPDWIGRLRKICLHARAIDGWEIGTGVEHVMATELRAAYVQMDAVWKHLPAMFRLDEMDGGWWAEEASNGMLATYDHPMPLTLMGSVGRGGFRNGEDEMSYAQLAVWLGGLGLGYGLALDYLSQMLGGEGDITSRVTEVLRLFAEEPS